MSDLRELILDMRTYAHEAPSHCAALMRRAALVLETVDKRVFANADQQERSDARR
jgi:hypothetical protein